MQSHAPQVFRGYVAAVNRAEQRRPKETAGREAADVMWPAIELPVALIETDEAGVLASAGAIEPLLVRVRARLGFLRAMLGKRQREASAPVRSKTRKPTP